MRVVLRNPCAADGRDLRRSLTVGAEYEVLGIECDSLRLLTDAGEPVLFDATCFEVSDPTEPTFWINPFPDETERYAYPHAYPPGWGVPGFFEAWHDNVAVVRELFAAQLAALYPAVAANAAESGPGRASRSS